MSHSDHSVKLVCRRLEILPDLRYSCLPGKCIMNKKHVSQRLFSLIHRWKRELYACTHVTNVYWMQIECAIYVASSSLSCSFDSVSSTVPVSEKARYHAKRNLKQVRSGRICVWFILFLIIRRCFQLSGCVPSSDKLIMDDEFVENCGSFF
jgi:hypothetical protein